MSYLLITVIILSMKVSDVSGEKLSCCGMTMIWVAECEIRSWPVTVVQLQSAVVSYVTLMVLDLHWAAQICLWTCKLKVKQTATTGK